MSPAYESAEAFRQALTDRLRSEASRRGVPTETLRTKVFIERLLARLFHDPAATWVLKGGYSFELRYRPRARTTRDIDLSMDVPTNESTAERTARVRDELQRAAGLDLDDHIVFRIGTEKRMLQGAPHGGATYPVQAAIAGRPCAEFHIDVGFGDALTGGTEELLGDDMLAFAGIPPARVRSISTAQQFAEKIHAYSFPWKDRENSRVKDLVDLVLLIERAHMLVESVMAAIRATFAARCAHAIPLILPAPPESWRAEFRSLATEAGIESSELDVAFTKLSAFWSRLGEPGTREMK